MKTVQFTGAERELLREALEEDRKGYSHERRREDVPVLTAVDNILEKLSSDQGDTSAGDTA